MLLTLVIGAGLPASAALLAGVLILASLKTWSP